MRDIVINGVNVPAGKQVQINIGISRLPTHTLIDLPVFVYRAKTDGPGLLLTAGIHGDEINGIEVLRRLIQEKALLPERGSVIAIPLVNVYGFIASSRNLPDGKDLNRCFPGTPGGSLGTRLAYILMSEVVPHVEYGVDFHTGGARIANYPQIRCTLDNDLTRQLAQAFNAPFTVQADMIDKSFRKEASRKGKTILVYEGGESLRLDEFAIEQGKLGVKRLMQYLAMRKHAESPPPTTTVLRQNTWLRAKASGIFNAFVDYGVPVSKNQPVANITDPYGQAQVTLKSPYDGYVVGLNMMPVVNAGDALVHLGAE
ncbi:MAG: succinylglutamate desuccinylase/aspartoacylase family protein [Ferruginibacter sp.]|nr:succinylglutamate desuccinylase/aspartoacylase family protein [Cytophagales bacterium]